MTDEPEPFLRPFLSRPGATGSMVGTRTEDDTPETTVVRAYMMTAGTHPGQLADTRIHLAFESMVSLTDRGRASVVSLQFERAKIARLVSQQSQSVAEIAATLRIPLGVTQVLCADMVGADLLEHHHSNANLSDDVSLLTRLINGVRSL